jgi:hypothetical protein
MSFKEKWIESIVADKLRHFLCIQIFEPGEDINFFTKLKKSGHRYAAN